MNAARVLAAGTAPKCEPLTTAWVACTCGEWLCTIHEGEHAWECACPPVDEWDCDPYSTALTPLERQTIRARNP